MKNNEVKFMHLRAAHPETGEPMAKGGLTIAYRLEDKNDHDMCVYGYAICHPDDNYNKKIGRQVALNSLQKEARVMIMKPFQHYVLAHTVVVEDSIADTREYLL